MPHAVQYARRGVAPLVYICSHAMPAMARKNLVLWSRYRPSCNDGRTVRCMQVGVSAFLIDEDTCASNFMTRDTRMQQLVSPEKEPITPFVHRVRECMTRPG